MRRNLHIRPYGARFQRSVSNQTSTRTRRREPIAKCKCNFIVPSRELRESGTRISKTTDWDLETMFAHLQQLDWDARAARLVEHKFIRILRHDFNWLGLGPLFSHEIVCEVARMQLFGSHFYLQDTCLLVGLLLLAPVMFNALFLQDFVGFVMEGTCFVFSDMVTGNVI